MIDGIRIAFATLTITCLSLIFYHINNFGIGRDKEKVMEAIARKKDRMLYTMHESFDPLIVKCFHLIIISIAKWRLKWSNIRSRCNQYILWLKWHFMQIAQCFEFSKILWTTSCTTIEESQCLYSNHHLDIEFLSEFLPCNYFLIFCIKLVTSKLCICVFQP